MACASILLTHADPSALDSASSINPSSCSKSQDPSALLMRTGRAASMNSLSDLASASSGSAEHGCSDISLHVALVSPSLWARMYMFAASRWSDVLPNRPSSEISPARNAAYGFFQDIS